MKHRHNSSRIPNTAPPASQVNPVLNQQLGMQNPQQMGNGSHGGFMPNNRPSLPPFMNFPNQSFPLQNPMAQFQNGQNFNPFQVNQLNQLNPSQQQGQFFPHNSMNPAPFNQDVNSPAGQFAMQKLLQNAYQLLQMQNCQFVPGNMPMIQNQMPPQDLNFLVNQQFGSGPFLSQAPGSVQAQHGQNSHSNLTNFQNPMAQCMGPQDLSALVNQPFGFGNSNGVVQQVNQQQKVNTGQPLQGNSFLPPASGSLQAQQALNPPHFLPNFQENRASGPVQHVNQQQDVSTGQPHINASNQFPNMGQPLKGNSLLPHVSGSFQTQHAPIPLPVPTNFQGNHVNEPANVNTKRPESQHKNFTGHNKNDFSQKGFKPQFHHTDRPKGRFGMQNKDTKNKGFNGDGASNSLLRNSTDQRHAQKRVPSLQYNKQEIKQWREERKKYYPSKANVEKKLTEKQTSAKEAKLRRQQLKEILAKQAELGCEVADIPLPYLSDSEKQNQRGKKQPRDWQKKGNLHNKRGRPHQVDHFAKKKNQDSANGSDDKLKKREPSLLQKLLMRDIKREKSHVLQVLRFMAVNSFFTGEGEKPLRFPKVIVRETEEVEKPVICEGAEEEEEGEIME